MTTSIAHWLTVGENLWCRQGRSDLMMAALRSSVLRDHLCWLWRMGNDSGDTVLAEAALFAEQVLRVLGVEHASLDDMLCQVSTLSTSALLGTC